MLANNCVKYVFLMLLFFGYHNCTLKCEPLPAYGTHQPILKTVVLNTEGPILELGVGNFSTYLLHEICKKNKRFLLSAESDEVWLRKFYNLKTEWHQFVYVDSYDQWANVGSGIHWSVVFVDHAPAWRRIVDIDRLRPYTDIFIIHDTEKEADHVYHYEPLLSTFKYHFKSNTRPATSVVSDTVDVRLFFEK